MRIALNLSSEPFRRDRPLILASIATGMVLVGLLAMLVFLAVQEHGQAAAARQDIANLQKDIATVGQRDAQLQALLGKPENAEVLDKVLFINSLLYRKGISWTKIFSDLEGVMPYNVRLISVRPQVDSQNEIYLDMSVGSQAPLPVFDFVKRLEGSPLFSSVQVLSSAPPTQDQPLFRYRMSVNYGRTL